MAVEKWLEELVSIPGGWGLTGQVFIIIFLALVAELVQRVILNRMHRKAEKTRTPWDDALLGSVRKPLSALIWLVGISLAAEIIARQSDAALFDYIQPARELGLIAIVTWFVLRFIGRAERTIMKYSQHYDSDIDQTAVDAVAKLLKATVAITSGLVVLQTLGVSISGILAFGGVGGIAVGFAARDMLANFFGSLTIYLDKPFKVGDWVRSPDREIEGTVEKIGWRSTRIRTFDQRPLYIPNAAFTTIVVENPSRMLNRRINETVGIRYDDYAAIREIVDDIRQMLEQHADIDQDRTLIVNFLSFGGSSLDIMVYCLTRTINWVEFHAVKQDVLLKIGDIIEGHGAEIAFPTRTLHLASQVATVPEGASQ
ncbi:MAG: mechanosensitive ion channel family protein [Gammaproteobacteria bacterium]|nr:mechanosensitive ion channel family protein [Gammaproteobacteria bacterium]